MKDTRPEIGRNEFDLHPTLTQNQCWENVFQTKLPSDSTLALAYKEMAMRFSGLVNIGVGLSTYINEKRIFSLTESEIDSKNVIPVPFLFGTEPNVFDFGFVRYNIPKAINITERSKMNELEKKLNNDGVLNGRSEFAGAILLIHTENVLVSPRKINLIAVGVVENETNKPVGFVICPEKMFAYEFSDTDDGPKRKQKSKKAVRLFAPQSSPVGVEI